MGLMKGCRQRRGVGNGGVESRGMAHTLGLNCVSECELQMKSPVACKAI